VRASPCLGSQSDPNPSSPCDGKHRTFDVTTTERDGGTKTVNVGGMTDQIACMVLLGTITIAEERGARVGSVRETTPTT
jgi:hypothetical protein